VLAAAGESDRLTIWGVSTPKATRNLVRGGGLKTPTEARAALVPLENEYASGAVDLKDAIERVAKEFDGRTTRQQVILYLGDGESALNPLDEAGRYKIAADLRAQHIAFYAVPLGAPMNPHNLHALVSGTGGARPPVPRQPTAQPKARLQDPARRVPKAPPGPGAAPAQGGRGRGGRRALPGQAPAAAGRRPDAGRRAVREGEGPREPGADH